MGLSYPGLLDPVRVGKLGNPADSSLPGQLVKL